MKDIKMDIEVRVHNGYTEWTNALKQGINLRQMFGRHQFIYTHKKHVISLVELKDYFEDKWFWEIFCKEGDLFEDVERFDGKQLAENRIILLLRDANCTKQEKAE